MGSVLSQKPRPQQGRARVLAPNGFKKQPHRTQTLRGVTANVTEPGELLTFPARGPGTQPPAGHAATWLVAAQSIIIQKEMYTTCYPSPPGLFSDPHLPNPLQPQERPRGRRGRGGSGHALVHTVDFWISALEPKIPAAGVHRSADPLLSQIPSRESAAVTWKQKGIFFLTPERAHSKTGTGFGTSQAAQRDQKPLV